ncbi:hypothetical protein GALMADRAFT_139541 [Galerina marginata CBS 339.88]|uniref:DUF6534 domain-containing protein n=1 Tax=Galerina marginata (strain CBS 339.88) TaxID=685588 RepID=A0A067T0A8_GALM3|nr:hypothetical protein GALMADRAFT_139541 [Galerina marginata CBS 339.88]
MIWRHLSLFVTPDPRNGSTTLAVDDCRPSIDLVEISGIPRSSSQAIKKLILLKSTKNPSYTQMENSQGINLSQTLAPLYWGFVVSLLLGGITIVQAYIYFPAQQDRFWARFTNFSRILDLLSSILIAQSVYYYLIPHFGSLQPLSSVTPELSAECLVSTMITFISQAFFVYQLYNVKRLDSTRWIVLGSIAGCAIIAFAGGIACVASMYVFHHGVLSNRNGTFSIFFGIAKGFGAATDIIATAAMCMYLTSSRTGIERTTTLLNKLMRYVIHRGVLVTLIQTVLLVTFYAAPDHLYWIAFHINVTKLYANTFFAMLNGRRSLQDTRASAGPQKLAFQNEEFNLREIEENDGTIRSANMPTITTTVETLDL